MSLLYTLLILLALEGCSGKEPLPPHQGQVIPPEPAKPLPSSKEECSLACTRMRELSCEIGRPTARGATCEDVCVNAMSNGLDFHTQRRKNAKSSADCDEAAR